VQILFLTSCKEIVKQIENINYKDKNYTFAMNGQTGKLVGNIPIDVKRTIIISLIIFIISTLIVFAIVWVV